MFAPGTILVADRSAAGGTGAVLAVDPASGTQRLVASGGLFANPSAVVVERDGNLLVIDPDAFGGGGGIIGVDPSTGAQVPLSQGGVVGNPFAAAVDSDGSILLGGLLGGHVARVDPSTGVQTKVLHTDSLESVADLAIDRDGSILVVANVERGGELLRIDRATGEISPVPGTDFQNLTGVAVAPDGNYWVLEDRHGGIGPCVERFDPVTKHRTLVSNRGLLRGLFRIALEAGGTVVVSDPGIDCDGRLTRVDRTTGAQSILSQGGSMVEPFGVTVV